MTTALPDEPACRFAIPQPPSTNHLRGMHVGADGRMGQHRTRAYKAWIGEAGWAINMALAPRYPQKMAGPIRMLIEGVKGIDLDNIKAIPDLCKTMHLIVDDNQIKDLRVTAAGGEGNMVVVSIWPMP